MARLPLLQWPLGLALALALSAGGCTGFSIPLGELATASPAITGSTTVRSPVDPPLPAGLAVSDAKAIAEAARRALAGEGGREAGGWTNRATGSTGNLVALGEAEHDAGETCRKYAATVTSIKGVHMYTSRACRSADGEVAIRSIEAARDQAPRTAGI